MKNVRIGVIVGLLVIAVASGAIAIGVKVLANSDPLTNSVELRSVSMVSESDGWAVGEISGKPNSILLHYAQGRWAAIAKPAGLSDRAELTAVFMLPSGEGWALGEEHVPSDAVTYTLGSVLLHYTHQEWRVVSSPSPSVLRALVALPTGEVWAVGDLGLVMRYVDGDWQAVQTPKSLASVNFAAISAPTVTDIWVCGDNTIAHYDGRSWQSYTIQASAPAIVRLSAISMVTNTDGWVTAWANDNHHGYILRYANGQWPQEAFVPHALLSIAMLSADEGWAAGDGGTLVHFHGGSWTPQQSATDRTLNSVALSSRTAGWAVGTHGVVLRYTGGDWEDASVTWGR